MRARCALAPATSTGWYVPLRCLVCHLVVELVLVFAAAVQRHRAVGALAVQRLCPAAKPEREPEKEAWACDKREDVRIVKKSGEDAPRALFLSLRHFTLTVSRRTCRSSPCRLLIGLRRLLAWPARTWPDSCQPPCAAPNQTNGSEADTAAATSTTTATTTTLTTSGPKRTVPEEGTSQVVTRTRKGNTHASRRAIFPPKKDGSSMIRPTQDTGPCAFLCPLRRRCVCGRLCHALPFGGA